MQVFEAKIFLPLFDKKNDQTSARIMPESEDFSNISLDFDC